MKVIGIIIKWKVKEYIILIIDRYEGDWRNCKREGKGIVYYNNGDREMGDYYNDKQIGKHVILKKNGEVEINNY